MGRLEDESVVYDETVIGGTMVRYGYVDKDEYRSKLAWEREQARVVMRPFRQWLQKEMKLQDSRARDHGALAWKLLRDTGNEPATFVYDTTIPRQSRVKAKASVRYLCLYLLSREGEISDGDISWAKRVLRELSKPVPAAQDLESVTEAEPEKKAQKPPPRPLYPDEYAAAVKTWRDYCFRTNVSAQRYIAGMLVLSTGIQARELVLLSRDDIQHLHDTGNLRITTWRAGKNRVIPVRGLKRETRILLDLPAEWSSLSDLLCPAAHRDNRVEQASALITRLFRVGITEPLELPGRSFLTRVRHYLAYQAWRRGEPLLAQTYLAYVRQDRVTAMAAIWEHNRYAEEWDPSRYEDGTT